MLPTAFYWDANEGTRAFGKRFLAAHPKKMMPNDMHAGMYAATEHLIKAMAETKSAADGVKLVDAMKAIPTDDPLFGKGVDPRRRARAAPDLSLPGEVAGRIEIRMGRFRRSSRPSSAEDAFRPLDKGGCPLVKA